jgi:NADH:ubiquinone oxidoreductase subunit E
MKNKLTVCCGTTCYLASGNRIDKLEQLIEQEFGDIVDVVPSGCLGQCSVVNKKSDCVPPFVKFNDEIIPNATNDNIIKELKKRL